MPQGELELGMLMGARPQAKIKFMEKGDAKPLWA